MEQSPLTAAALAQSWAWRAPTESPLAPALPLLVTAALLLLAMLWLAAGHGGSASARRSAAGAGITPLPLGHAAAAEAAAAAKSRPPSPRGGEYCPPTTLPVLGNLLDLLRHTADFHDWLAELAQHADGRPVRLVLPGKPDLLVLSTPAQFEAVQKHQLESFIKGPSLHELLFELMGDGIFTVNGDKWKRQRQLLVRLFTARAMREHIAPIVRSNIRTLLSILDRAAGAGDREAHVMDLFALMKHLTLDTFAELAFGVRLEGLRDAEQRPGARGREFQQAFDDAQFLVAQRFTRPTAVWKLQRWLNVGPERRLRAAMDVVNGVALGIISQCIARRQEPDASKAAAQPAHLVEMLLEAADADRVDVTPTQVRDMVTSALIAGRDTTAETLSWSLHLLQQYPRVVSELRAELREAGLPVGGDQSEPYVPTMDDVQALPYLEATIREVMRLYPSGAFTTKHCIKDSWLPAGDEDGRGGTFIPAGTDVGMAVFAMGRLPRVWGPDAAQFRPERFLDRDTGKLLSVSPFRFSAFSGGPRVCVGQALATLQVKLVLSAVLLRFDVSEVPGQEVTYTSGITLPLKDPLRVRFARC